MSDERAEAVAKFKCIYDKDDANYHNDDVKTHDGSKVKTRRENLRKAYIREYKKVKQGYVTSYYLYDNMNFLDKYVFHIQSAGNLHQKAKGGIAKTDNSTADKEKKRKTFYLLQKQQLHQLFH
ncbi:hypothetical protein TSAR_014832 [Trichomalopsis sarcophagae]|uniref:Uncharacterized protein n=1 Tax=Trichomalopsis sarcophagae TaxID=543379 RepID=A0A232EPQ6_9HYME|nr:hypothetical protein TSAR_014832 [Trichomalopsis sarcophagae]